MQPIHHTKLDMPAPSSEDKKAEATVERIEVEEEQAPRMKDEAENGL